MATDTLIPPPAVKSKKARRKAKDQDPARMYEYGALAPTENQREVRKQMWAAHIYSNRLRAVERARRLASAAVLNRHFPELEALGQACLAKCAERDALKDAIKARRKQSRRRDPATMAELAQLAVVKAELRELYARHKPMKKASWSDPRVKAELDEVTAAHLALAKLERKHTDAYWGTYLVVESSLRDMKTGAPPEDKHWRGDGHIAVQFQKPLPVEHIYRPNTRAYLIHIKWRANHRERTATDPGRHGHRHVTLRLRVNSDQGKPVWASFPLVLHRELHPGSVIRWVHVMRKRVGTVERYTACFTISNPAGFPPPQELGVLQCGLDVGWRSRPVHDGNGLRVALWAGNDGDSGEWILPQHLIDMEYKARDLGSIRDLNFNKAKLQLSAWKRDNKDVLELPEWFQHQTKNVGLWQSVAQLWKLVGRWKRRRFNGDEVIYQELLAWWTQERHLHDWQRHASRHFENARKYQYRLWVHELRKKYGTVCIEQLDLREFSTTPEPEEEQGSVKQVVTNRRLACLSQLCGAVKAGGWRVILCPAEYTTQQCHVCHSVEKFDQSAELFHTCGNCQTRWDQDYNAARNLLAAIEHLDNPEASEAA